MTTIFASDFHGTGDMYINKIQRMIKKYPAAHIVFGGDYIDGRPDSKQVINYIWQMQRKHHAIALKGNHEDMLDAFLKDDDEQRFNYNGWRQNGGNTTFKSLFGRKISHYVAHRMLCNYRLYDSNYLQFWLASLKVAHINEDGLFVHAYANVESYNTAFKALMFTSTQNRLWERKAVDMLIHNHTEKALVVGHTPTCFFAENQLNFEPVHITPYGSKTIAYQESKCPIIEYHYDNEQSVIACDGGCHGGDNFNTGNVVVIDKGKIIDCLN